MSCAVRYVVLAHEGIDPPHFDFMVEHEPGSELLRTWRIDHWPIRDLDPLQRLPDHRRHYLDYEGPVSNNRGTVRRITSGTILLEASGSDNVIGYFADTGVEIDIVDYGQGWVCYLGA